MSGLRFARGSAKGVRFGFEERSLKDILGGGTNEQTNECG